MPAPPPNAYLPGTKLSVGSHKISIIKYLSQGGFAYVYTCNIDPPFQGSLVACLKRVEVPNKWELTLLRQEVDAMRRLRGNKHIVSYIDSHASRMDTASKNSASSGTTPSSQLYEVFLLMEYCENNGLIDMMNSRLMNKLTEPEILTIMYEITAATAMCHHLQPPLIHRDIKIENVLIDRHGVFKLCDFGSSVGYIPPPTTPQEFAAVREDIMQHTTPQYKSPEMIDLTRGFPIDDKLDIWALGVFMYKLLYYTTPFELALQKTMQDMELDILNCATTLKFKDQPGLMFSPRLKNIVKCCLREDPRRRPNAVQLLGEIAAMKGVPMPEVIPYSVRHMRHSQTGKVQPAAQKVVAPAPQPSVPSLPPRKDPFSSIDKSSLLRRPNSTYDRPKSFIEGSYSQHNKSSNSIQDYIQLQIEITKLNEQIAPDQNEATNTLDFLRGKEEENQRQDTGGSFKASLKILRKISTGGSISSLTANHTNEKKKWGREREARERDITPTARDRERDVTPRSMARERDVEKEREKEREKAKESAQVKSAKMGSSLKPTVSHKSTGKSSKTTPSTSVVKLTSKPAVKAAAKPTAKSATSHIPKLAAVSSSVKPSTSPDTGLKKLSIQKRMQILFTNQESEIIAPISTGLKKTAKGYGRYTDVAPDEEIDAINKLSSPSPPLESKRKLGLVPPKIPLALSAKKPQARSSTAQVLASYKAITPPVRSATVSAKKTPPKPTKPSHLKALAASDRRLSDASEISLPDLDDLEKQFARRFPSYV